MSDPEIPDNTPPERLDAAIVAFVQRRDWVTFAEVMRHLPGETGLTFTGDHALTLHERNLVLWPGLSYLAVECLRYLLEAERIWLHPTTPLTYYIDGMAPNLPIATSAHRYRSLRWLPVCLRTVPLKGLRRRGTMVGQPWRWPPGDVT